MPLHPDDVVSKTFRTTSLRRGYDEAEVDAFLEEIVTELRRLRRQVDEGQAAIDRMRRAAPEQQLAVEQEQLEQVRRERDALTAEVREADRHIASAREEVDRARAESDAELEQIKARLDEDLYVLKKRAHEEREEAHKLADEARVTEENLVNRLSLIRSEAEQAVANELGQDRVASLIAGLSLMTETGPLADLGVIAGMAEALRDVHVQHGLAVAQEIRVEAEAEREKMISEAAERAQRLLNSAQQQHDELLESARAERDRLIAEANGAAPGVSPHMVPETGGRPGPGRCVCAVALLRD